MKPCTAKDSYSALKRKMTTISTTFCLKTKLWERWDWTRTVKSRQLNNELCCRFRGWWFLPVLPSFLMVVRSVVRLSQPSNLNFWYCSFTWTRFSSMLMGDCLALLQDGNFLAQLFWFNVPGGQTETKRFYFTIQVLVRGSDIRGFRVSCLKNLQKWV